MIISFPPHFVNAYHLFVTIVKLIKKTAVDTQYLQPKFTTSLLFLHHKLVKQTNELALHWFLHQSAPFL